MPTLAPSRPGGTPYRAIVAALVVLAGCAGALAGSAGGGGSTTASHPPAGIPGSVATAMQPSAGLNLTFSESGLPTATPWSISTWTVGDQWATSVTTSSSSTTLLVPFADPTLLVDFQVWTVPSSTAGSLWVGVAAPAGPVALSSTSQVNVTFTLQNTSSVEFPVTVLAKSLPSGTAWSGLLNGAGFGSVSATASGSVGGGTTLTASAASVFLPNATAFLVGTYDVLVLAQNSSWTTTTSVSVMANGPVWIVPAFDLNYRLVVDATLGGTATPSSEWVPPGAPVALAATPSAGFVFGTWTGTGAGSVNATARNISIVPEGPVTMTAGFWLNFYHLTITETGVPLGDPFSILFLGSVYTSTNGTIYLPFVPYGDVNVSEPYSYANGTALVRYAATSFTSSFGPGTNSTIRVDGNGTIQLTYKTQFALTVATIGSGTTSPAVGSYWEDAGVQVVVTAAASGIDSFQSWAGTGAGSVNATTSLVVVTMDGPVTETARFGTELPPPSFAVTVTAAGLPFGVVWAVTDGALGTDGATPTLVLTGVPEGPATLLIPTLYGQGVRYAPNQNGTFDLVVGGNLSFSVAFSTEYAVTVAVGLGGSVGDHPDWAPAGGQLTLVAGSPATGYTFVGWTGDMVSNSTTIALTVTGPVNESAVYVPTSAGAASTARDGPLLAAAIGIPLVIGGLVVFALHRRRQRAEREGPGPTS